MAQTESDREDLMREAVALVRRAELSYPGRPSDGPVTLGFRRDGSLAIYFGADPVYQFDQKYRLRRAYVAGHLYRSQGQTLARLTRERSPKETVLVRLDLDAEELEAFLKAARNQLTELQEAMRLKCIEVRAHVPTNTNCVEEVEEFVAEVLRQEMPLAPAIPGKR